MTSLTFVQVAEDLEIAGLLWQPEIGDEISPRGNKQCVSILVDPHGMTPRELRESFIWLPNTEQMLYQVEVRQAILYHAGLELSHSQLYYKTVLRSTEGLIESYADNLRLSLGLALRDLLSGNRAEPLH